MRSRLHPATGRGQRWTQHDSPCSGSRRQVTESRRTPGHADHPANCRCMSRGTPNWMVRSTRGSLGWAANLPPASIDFAIGKHIIPAQLANAQSVAHRPRQFDCTPFARRCVLQMRPAIACNFRCAETENLSCSLQIENGGQLAMKYKPEFRRGTLERWRSIPRMPSVGGYRLHNDNAVHERQGKRAPTIDAAVADETKRALPRRVGQL